MATIVTRAIKGSPLTITEMDSNFTNLNTDKAEINSQTFTGTPTLPAGTIATTQAIVNNTTAIATTAYVDRHGTWLIETSGSYTLPYDAIYSITAVGGGGASNSGGYAGGASPAAALVSYYLPAGTVLAVVIGAGGVFNVSNGGNTTVTNALITTITSTGGNTGAGGVYSDGIASAFALNTGGTYNDLTKTCDGILGGGGAGPGIGPGSGAGGDGAVLITW